MVNIIQKENQIVFEMIGMHKFWAMQNTITIEKENIIRAYQSEKPLPFWKGIRAPGTEIPGIIAAGTFYKNGKNFWDVVNRSKTIIVELKNESFQKLFIEVKNPIAALQLLNTK